jgi:hypothetical protein
MIGADGRSVLLAKQAETLMSCYKMHHLFLIGILKFGADYCPASTFRQKYDRLERIFLEVYAGRVSVGTYKPF